MLRRTSHIGGLFRVTCSRSPVCRCCIGWPAAALTVGNPLIRLALSVQLKPVSQCSAAKPDYHFQAVGSLEVQLTMTELPSSSHSVMPAHPKSRSHTLCFS